MLVTRKCINTGTQQSGWTCNFRKVCLIYK